MLGFQVSSFSSGKLVLLRAAAWWALLCQQWQTGLSWVALLEDLVQSQ